MKFIANSNRVGQRLIVSLCGEFVSENCSSCDEEGSEDDNCWEALKRAFDDQQLKGVTRIVINTHRDMNRSSAVSFHGSDCKVADMIKKHIPLGVTVKINVVSLAKILGPEFVMTSEVKKMPTVLIR